MPTPGTRRSDSVREKKSALGRGLARFCYLTFGVLTPLLAVVVEYGWNTWEEVAFDPVPTPLHAAAIVLVALTVALLLNAKEAPEETPKWVRGWLWGAATGIAGWYAIVFLPWTPLALVGLIVMGAGLLPLSPLTALAALLLRRPGPGLWRPALLAMAASLTVLSLVDLPKAVAHVMMTQVGSPSAETSDRAVARLRSLVPDAVIRSAVERPVSMLSPVGAVARLGWPRATARFQVAAWRATGEFVVPREPDRSWLLDGPRWDPNVLAELGGTAVGTLDEELFLSSSEWHGESDPAGGVADLHWELRFRNDDERWGDQAEARALVRLPRDAVVSDAWLWVAGERRPAVFASREQARAAYESVVRVERRDPLLVTAAGDDGVLVQCFPIAGAGGTIRIALRIAVPLEMASDGLELALPYVAERNFRLDEGGQHVEVLGLAGGDEPPTDTVPFGALDSPRSVNLGERTPAAAVAWAPHRFEDALRIERTYETVAASPPESVVLLMDASASTRSVQGVLASCLAALPDELPVCALLVGDEVVEATDGFEPLSPALRDRIAGHADELAWEGGVDATPGLTAALEHARSRPGARLLWLHGAQALHASILDPETWVALGDPTLDPSSEPEETLPLVEDLAAVAVRIAPGSNQLVVGLRTEARLQEPALAGDTAEERVTTLLGEWFDGAPGHRAVFDLREGGAPAEGVGTRLPHALTALWAASVARDATTEEATTAARDLAVRHRVVTAHTGAVVLETEADYQRAGLDPPAGAPSIPEPEEWALLAVVLVALATAWFRRRRLVAA